MIRGTFLRVGIIVFIGAVSAVFVLHGDPEYTHVVSEDGTVTVTGFTRADDFVVTQEDGAAWRVVGNVYRITPDAALHDLPVQVVFRHADDDAYDVARYDDDLRMWERQDATRVDATHLSVHTTQLGRFALLPSEDVAAPDFVAVYDALRMTAPHNAVGYRIAVGYAHHDGPSIRLPDTGEQGGCGGAVLPGKTTEYAAQTRSAQVLVNDVQTAVTFTFLATWFVDPDGCPPLQPFHAADEYGILPASS